MKLMAVDYGRERVGVASTDESGKFALPRAVFPHTADLAERLLEFAHENEIELIVLGESKGLDGKPNPVMEDILSLKKELEEGGAKTALHTEVFTTMEAARIQGRGEKLDASAAALILKSYIDSRE